jgi:hypothetical protein
MISSGWSSLSSLPTAPVSPWAVARAAATAAVGALAAAGSLLTLVRWGSAGPFTATGPVNADEVVAQLMVWAAVALSGWLGLGSLLAVGATLPGAVGDGFQALARRLTPALLRQGVAVAIGTAVATLSLPVASAAGMGVARSGGVTQPGGEAGVTPTAATGPTSPAPSPVFAPTIRSGAASVPAMRDVAVPTSDGTTAGPAAPAGQSPAWRPTRPAPRVDARRARLLAPAPRTDTAMDAMVTVRRGDSLWSIAARHLGPGASDAEIALAWPRWYAANRDLIGTDPDHLLPGQQLCPPPAGEDQ